LGTVRKGEKRRAFMLTPYEAGVMVIMIAQLVVAVIHVRLIKD
jgi:hypothetical protein